MNGFIFSMIITIVGISTFVVAAHGIALYIFEYYKFVGIIFPLQYYIHKEYGDKLNIVGLTILDILSIFFTICGSFLTLGIIVILETLKIFREIFFITFRKENL